MKVYFATWLYDKSLGVSMKKHGVETQLISYHFLTDQKITKNQLSRYVRTGRHKKIEE